MSEFQVARAGEFDDITIYALADGSRLKVWDGPEPPDPELVNLWLDPSDEILKHYDVDDGWTDAGIVGATGEQGPQGERGEKGDTGERGPGGEKGETGARGEIGPRGLRGQQGDAGIPGPKGDKGSRGDTGERGPKGDKGDTGERGQRGPRGYSVLSGRRNPEPEDGQDNDFWINIQTALIFGPKTDGEWGQGASIRGPMGPRGLTGSVGPQGSQGETGPQGPQGEPGSGDGGGPVDWSDITFDDGRPEYGGEQLALWSDRELEEDSRAESAAITDYPSGISIMPVSADANWDGQGSQGHVLTEHTDNGGRQWVVFTDFGGWSLQRFWDIDLADWAAWKEPVFTGVNPYVGIAQNTVPLPEDALAEANPITDYLTGITIMPVSAEANWHGTGFAGTVVTERTVNGGSQHFVTEEAGRFWRFYDLTTPEWGEWENFVTNGAFVIALRENPYYPTDSWAESDGPAAYNEEVSFFQTSAGANWNGTGLAGIVATAVSGSTAKQTFSVPSTETSYTRYYDSGAWSLWSSGGGSSDAATLEGEDGAYYLDRTNHTGTQALATVTGHDKAAHDALDIDADTLDGHDTSYFAAAGAAPTAHAASHKGDGSDPIANATTSVAGLESAADKTKLDGVETGATADQTAAEILTAIKTVDGTGSGLDADTLDGHDTAYFAVAGAAPATHATTHTNGTDDIQNATSGQKGLATAAQITKLDGIESAATADQTAAEILTAVKTVDGTGSGLDADLLDGVNSTGFVQTGDYEDSDVLAKVKNVDGTGSGLDADTLDGIEASAFLQSAFYQTIKEGGTARTQRAAINFGNGLDATDDAGNNETDVVVDESELTHNSLGGLTTGDPHTQYHTDARGDARYTPIAHVGAGGTAHANAVAAGAAGFLTGSDKTKLDGIETGATADQTAAEILAALLTVDGSGTGLDADLLDAHDTSYFLARGNHTGTQTASTISDFTSAVTAIASPFALTEVEVNFGTRLRKSGNFTISGLSGLTTGRHVLIRQASGPYTNKGTLADEFEMDSISVTGKTTNATTIQCYWHSDGFVRGNFKFAYAVG